MKTKKEKKGLMWYVNYVGEFLMEGAKLHRENRLWLFNNFTGKSNKKKKA